MPHLPPTAAVVQQARQSFFVDGCDAGAGLAEPIHRSWRRCAGLSSSVPEPLPGQELSLRREASAWLRRCAQPELDGLAEHVVQQGCVVVLSDAGGLILDAIGSADFLPRSHRLALVPGVDWSETMRGTNAIGTALLEREALMVLGGEHFLDQNGALGCAAAPIFNARGELAGVLDISGESGQVTVHALGLVQLAAAQLEHRMMSTRSDGRLLRFHRRPGLLGTPREGLLSVQDGRIVGANRTALGLLGLGWGETLGASASRIFGERWQRLQTAPGLVAAADGQLWAVAMEQPAQVARRPAHSAAASPGPGADAVEPLLKLAIRVLSQGIPVLVTGETGSGKEVFVRRLHRASRRAAGPLVAVNCAALPENLIEAELFGYEDGAFTGARRRGMPGRLREAQGGILFLDEIGDMPLALQSRLLRVLEERVVRPLGAQRDFAVDFDLVCATHRDLRGMVQQGVFREDLLYRLQGYTVPMPPLRERADRRELIQKLLADAGAAARGIRLSDAALDDLDRRPWPGNVRELLSALRTLVALADDGTTLEPADLQPTQDNPIPAGAAAAAALDESARPLSVLAGDAIQRAMASHQGNVAAAARQLGLHRSTLYRLLARKRA